MSTITWTNAFTNGQTGQIGTKLQQNFTDATTVLNGQLDETNINTASDLNIKNVDMDTLISPNIINTTLANDLELSFGSGTPKKLLVTDSDDVSLFEVDNSGNITIPLGMTDLYPIGAVIDFTGSFVNNSTIPGWYQCDGNNGTPDLQDLFIVGGTTSGFTGGYSDITVGIHTHIASSGNNAVSHTHTVVGTLATADLPSHHHILSVQLEYVGGSLIIAKGGPTSSSQHSTDTVGDEHTHTISTNLLADTDTHTHTITVDPAGTGETGVGDNIPAYYTLIPIMRIS